MSPAFRLRGVVHAYDAAPVLSVPELDIAGGRITALVGPNGAGKSTLLDLLAFVQFPREGRLEFFGERVTPGRALRLRRRVGLVAQNPYLFRGSVLENVETGLRLRRVAAPERVRRSRAVLDRLGIGGLAGHGARRLSGGEAQKVALARALVLEPEVLLLDEPFTYLDAGSLQDIEALVRELNREHGRTVVFTTHDRLRGQALAGEVLSVISGHLTSGTLVNLFRGRLRDGHFDTGRVRIEVAAAGAAGGHLAIEPERIVLSREPLASSMRNALEGRVTGIVEEREGRVRVSVEAGERFEALITRASLREQQIELGARVWLSFKSTAVEIF